MAKRRTDGSLDRQKHQKLEAMHGMPVLKIDDSYPVLEWFDRLSDRDAARVFNYVERVSSLVREEHKTGSKVVIRNTKPVGNGVFEIVVGDSVFRVYFGKRGGNAILILGGNKRTQTRPKGTGDIVKAKEYWRRFLDEKDRGVVLPARSQQDA